ncbi:hypothetical protein BCR32DRAFT_226002 [Anaeromyces robustus]|jgi:hypothetical protein|uniref:Cellulase n=1 Tax=Anaeromyces robustus TaxID=1754192 RepID=A0A1Y1VYG8_9FUNG|nr:hypothetical protein BCR32DRAFT_226002 [Anaeromyces robustus]|eukprot:ORX66085.1 hypothetical protein BCR32DRAFT_226002 [Anaeromyces robustus]
MEFKSILLATALLVSVKACSFLPDYPCCKEGAEAIYEDAQGKWGVENGQWCGIEPEQPSYAACWSLPDYPCCEGTDVVYSDASGDWGVENGQWCGIVETKVTTTTKKTTVEKTTEKSSSSQPTKTQNKGSYTMKPFEAKCTVNTDQTDCVEAWKQCGGSGMTEKCCQAGTSCKGSEGYKQCEPDVNAELRPATGKGPHGQKWCDTCTVYNVQDGFLWGWEDGRACEIKMCECNDILNTDYTTWEHEYPIGKKKGNTTRYWDCCKPSCSWPEKALVSQPVQQCKKDGITPITNFNAKSGCEGGESFMCLNQQPWAVSEVLSYGYAAASIAGLTEADWCCRCYALTFTTGPAKGKQIVVQVTNTGGDLGENHFDLQIPGGGVGIFNGCSTQFNTDTDGWGERYGGIGKRSDCEMLPEEIRQACYWRFDWFLGSDNPEMVFDEVECPIELTQNTGCIHK